MKSLADDQRFEFRPKLTPVVQPGEFPIAAAGLDHGRIYDPCSCRRRKRSQVQGSGQ